MILYHLKQNKKEKRKKKTSRWATSRAIQTRQILRPTSTSAVKPPPQMLFFTLLSFRGYGKATATLWNWSVGGESDTVIVITLKANRQNMNQKNMTSQNIFESQCSPLTASSGLARPKTTDALDNLHMKRWMQQQNWKKKKKRQKERK